MNFPYGGRLHAMPQEGAPALQVRNLRVTYPGAERSALEDVSLAVEHGEKVALIGPNGAGKSTLIKAVAGLIAPVSGQILVYGNRVGACHHRTAYVPQRGEVRWNFPVTVEQAVMMGRYAHLGWLKRPGEKDRAAVSNTLEQIAQETLQRATKAEADLIGELQKKGMTFVTEKDGLKIGEFRERVSAEVAKDFPAWKAYMDRIAAVK